MHQNAPNGQWPTGLGYTPGVAVHHHAPPPRMHLVRQRFDATEVADFDRRLTAEARAVFEARGVGPGSQIAMAVGSRGVSPIAQVVRLVSESVQSLGGEPFIVPAMGSHGGGTAAGQAEVLAGYGISEAALGVPVRATMETVELGATDHGVPVHMDAVAAGADGIVVIGRVKPHTSFRGPVESGLCKMLAIGLGNRRGAETIHAHDIATTIPAAARVALAAAPVCLGVALVENAFDRPYRLAVVGPESFEATDRELLQVARGVLPRIPVDRLNLLLVDRMGKNVSGTGMDPNVIGMWRRLPELPHEPDYRWLAVLGLTEQSHGNAVGIGMADLTSRKLTDAIDPVPTHANVLTSMAVGMAKVPVTLPNDRECLGMGLALAARSSSEPLRVARIASTMELETLWLSDAALPELPHSCEVMASRSAFDFGPDGSIVEAGAYAH